MQIFEVHELQEFPYMEIKEVVQGQIVGDILNDTSIGKVFLLVDHDTKRIWTCNGHTSPLNVQIYGAILANKLRQQLKLFYRIYPLNLYSREDKQFLELLDKPIGAGRAKPIEKKEFSEEIPDKYTGTTSISNPNVNKAIEYINQIPPPDNRIRRFMVIGGTIFTDEEITESFLKEEKVKVIPIKLGRLNNGFTFFQDHNYSTRLIIKERMIQGIEFYINKDDKSPPIKIEVPIIPENKFNKPRSIDSLVKAFQIPEKLPEDNEK
ncbi:MAG: hypothetical protein ACFE91_12375 [Promethearchaeota archaeon]